MCIRDSPWEPDFRWNNSRFSPVHSRSSLYSALPRRPDRWSRLVYKPLPWPPDGPGWASVSYHFPARVCSRSGTGRTSDTKYYTFWSSNAAPPSPGHVLRNFVKYTYPNLHLFYHHLISSVTSFLRLIKSSEDIFLGLGRLFIISFFTCLLYTSRCV